MQARSSERTQGRAAADQLSESTSADAYEQAYEEALSRLEASGELDLVEQEPSNDAGAFAEAYEEALSHLEAQGAIEGDEPVDGPVASDAVPDDAAEPDDAAPSALASVPAADELARYSRASYEHSDYSRDASAGRYRARKGRSRGKKALVAAVVVLAVLLVGGGTAFGLWYKDLAGALKPSDPSIQTSPVEEGKPFYVLLLGGDSREDKKQDNRTDSIMVARVDTSKQKVSIVSVPRDLRVKIEGHGYCKINSAIEYGGYNQVIQKVDQVLGIQVNYYAFIYFSGFKDLVDELGGVTVEVPEGTYYNGVRVPAGDAVMIDGKEALVLARCRHGDPPDQGAYAMGDYQRTKNQRNLIKAIAEKVLREDKSKIPKLVKGLAKCIETNIDVGTIASLAQKMKGMDVDKIDTAQLPVAGASVNGEWYAVMYDDVFQVLDGNFTSGRKLMKGLKGFDLTMNDNDIGSDYVDGDVYAYTSYGKRYGSFDGS